MYGRICVNICMYVCMYVCICVCVNICLYVCMYIYICVNMHNKLIKFKPGLDPRFNDVPKSIEHPGNINHMRFS